MRHSDPVRYGGAGAWLARIAVLSALAATVWWYGPRAWAVSAAHLGDDPLAASVDLRRVGLIRAPDWLVGDLAVAILDDLEPRLAGGSGPVVDGASRTAAESVRARLSRSPFVARVALRPSGVDRWRVGFALRRPVLAVRIAEDDVALLDAEGMVLPYADVAGLPRITMHHGVAEARSGVRVGSRVADRRAIAALAVLAEWREVERRVPDAPALIEIDASNLDGAFVADPFESEVKVGVARRAGGTVWLRYGRAAADGGFVPVETKTHVLSAMLAAFPGLDALDGGDLRLRNRWRNCVVVREGGAEPAPGRDRR